MKDKKIDRHSLENDDRYELIPILVESVVVNPEDRSFVVLSDGNKKSIIEINSYETGMLTFVAKDYHKNSHIQTIHQAFIKSLDIYKSKIISVEIENKVGDVVYTSIKFEDSNLNNYFLIMSLCDGLILSILSQTNLNIVANVWDNMEPLDEDWDYENFMFDED
jgi:hypothetical protein